MAEAQSGASPIPADRYPVEAGPALRILGVLCAVGAAVAGCSSTGVTTAGKSKPAVAQVDPVLGVAPSPRLVADGKPIPKGGGVFQTGKGYKIGGRTYTPTPVEPKNYTATGLASYYAGQFHGRRTANGEIFDQTALSAAHPSLPLPSYVRVTNLSNNRSVVVRVNDRGPFHRGRLIDVSKRTADLLGFRMAGVGRVKVDYVGLASLQGSDDRKLLATYQENGTETASSRLASLFEPQPTPAPPPPRPLPALVVAAAAPPPVIAAAAVPQPAPALRPAVVQTQQAARPAPTPAARIAAATIPVAASYGAPVVHTAAVGLEPAALPVAETTVTSSSGARQRVLLSWGGLSTPVPLAAASTEALPATATALGPTY